MFSFAESQTGGSTPRAFRHKSLRTEFAETHFKRSAIRSALVLCPYRLLITVNERVDVMHVRAMAQSPRIGKKSLIQLNHANVLTLLAGREDRCFYLAGMEKSTELKSAICLSLSRRCNLLHALLGKGEEPEIFMRIQYTQSYVFIAAGVASCWKRHGERARTRF